MAATPEHVRARPAQAPVRLALAHYVRQARLDGASAIAAMLLIGIGSTLVTYVPPFIVARVLAAYAGDGDPTVASLMPAIVALGVSWLGGEMFWRGGIHFLIRVETRGSARLYKDAMDYLLNKDLAFFHDNFAGSLTKKAVAYGRSYIGFMDTFTFQVLSNLLPLVFIVPVLWVYSPWLVAALAGFMGVTVVLVAPLIRRRQVLVNAREAASNVLSGHISDSLTNIDAVRAFAREPFEAEVHARNVDAYIAKAKRSWDYQNRRIDMVTSPMYVLTNVAGLMVAIAVSRGSAVSLEAVFLTFSYFVGFTRVMWEFNSIYRNLESSITEAAQFTELLLEPPTVTDAAAPETFAPADARVEFRSVTFRYSDASGDHLFRDLDLDIASGEKVGLVGRSGGGKTTVTRLLLRFMDIDDGAIVIGGHDIAAIEQRRLRAMIGYVPQDPVMFHRSLADNIRFGRLDATDDEVREAARMAHAAEFIDALPAGYDTLVGERGIKLSGGQRQRIAIARAMIKAAPILVLDEATSSLDSESERLIQDALWTLMEGRTAIVIAHRLSTVQRMDRLIVMDEGEIIEQGSHRQLLARGGVYAELWSHQSGGFLADDALEPAG